jgi:hypothetical protein
MADDGVNADRVPAFYIFRHNPFQKGSEGSESGNPILDNLLFHFPSSISDREIINFFGAILSLYTYATLSMNAPSLDFIGCSDSNVAIRTSLVDNDDHVLFVLRLPSTFSETSASQILDLLKNGFFFVLGPRPTLASLQHYIDGHGKRLCSLFLPVVTDPPVNVAMPDVPQLRWTRPAVIAALTAVCATRSHPEVLAICCRVGGTLLVSRTPIGFVQYFDFVPPRTFENRVFLDGPMRELIHTDKEDAVLYQLIGGDVVFFVLTGFEDRISPSAVSSLVHAAAHISEPGDFQDIAPLPPNILVYDAKLRTLRIDSIREDMGILAVVAHEGFTINPRWRDVIIQTPDQFAYARRMLSVEAYIFLDRDGGSLAEMCQQAQQANLSLGRAFRVFHMFPPSALD